VASGKLFSRVLTFLHLKFVTNQHSRTGLCVDNVIMIGIIFLNKRDLYIYFNNLKFMREKVEFNNHHIYIAIFKGGQIFSLFLCESSH
jgi:hypothetical protein